MLKVVYYYNHTIKKAPAKESINEIKNEIYKTKIYSFIDYVAENNGKTDGIVAKTIRGHKFFEIRIKISKNLYRIMYFAWQGKYIILLSMFLKKEGKITPQKQIDIAETNYSNFIKYNKFII